MNLVKTFFGIAISTVILTFFIMLLAKPTEQTCFNLVGKDEPSMPTNLEVSVNAYTQSPMKMLSSTAVDALFAYGACAIIEQLDH